MEIWDPYDMEIWDPHDVTLCYRSPASNFIYSFFYTFLSEKLNICP